MSRRRWEPVRDISNPEAGYYLGRTKRIGDGVLVTIPARIYRPEARDPHTNERIDRWPPLNVQLGCYEPTADFSTIQYVWATFDSIEKHEYQRLFAEYAQPRDEPEPIDINKTPVAV